MDRQPFSQQKITMSVRRLSFAPLLFVAALALASAGCQEKSASTAARIPVRPTPDKSFEQIVKLIKQGIELDNGSPSAIVFQKSGERSQITIHNEVTSALVPPTKEGDPYRGTITVTSHTVYSLRRSAESTDGTKGSEKSDSGPDSTPPDSTDKAASDVDVLDSNLVSTPASSGRPAKVAGDTVARRADDDVRVFELKYENGRWEQVTKTDPKTEQAVQMAFDRALRVQP